MDSKIQKKKVKTNERSEFFFGSPELGMSQRDEYLLEAVARFAALFFIRRVNFLGGHSMIDRWTTHFSYDGHFAA